MWGLGVWWGFFWVGIFYLSRINYVNVYVATPVPDSSVNLGCAGGN